MEFIDGFWFELGRVAGKATIVLSAILVVSACVFGWAMLSTRPRKRKDASSVEETTHSDAFR